MEKSIHPVRPQVDGGLFHRRIHAGQAGLDRHEDVRKDQGRIADDDGRNAQTDTIEVEKQKQSDTKDDFRNDQGEIDEVFNNPPARKAGPGQAHRPKRPDNGPEQGHADGNEKGDKENLPQGRVMKELGIVLGRKALPDHVCPAVIEGVADHDDDRGIKKDQHDGQVDIGSGPPSPACEVVFAYFIIHILI